jgi:serine/threonine protein kinase
LSEYRGSGGAHSAPEACGAASDPRIGEVLEGRYQIVRRLSVGGMGSVYEARHVVVQRAFAVKLLHPEYASRPSIVQRFEQEAKAVGALASEHIVAVVDFGISGGSPYLVMDLLQGQDLRQLLARERQLPAPRACKIAIDVCRGLRVAHAAGLIHRDLKPANIFITPAREGGELAKVLDFGVAKLRDVPSATGEGVLIGTIGYMAPEQVLSGKSVDQRSDVYSLGIVLHEAIQGKPAFEGERAELLYRIVHDGPPALQRENLPSALVQIVARATAREPAQRYPDVVALAQALVPFARGAGPVEFKAFDLTPLPAMSSMTWIDSEDGAHEACSDGSGAALSRQLAPPVAHRRITWLAIGTLAVAVALLGLLRRFPPTTPARDEGIRQVPALARSPVADSTAPPSSVAKPGIESLRPLEPSPAAREPERPAPEPVPALSQRDRSPMPRGRSLPWPPPSSQFDSKNPYSSPKP